MIKKNVYILIIFINIISNRLSAEYNSPEKTVSKYANKLINVYTNAKSMSHLGFGNSDFLYNGEELVIKTFIKKNDTVFDVGAYIGDWTKSVLHATESQCFIYAFEPIPDSYKFLERLKNQYNNKVFSSNSAIGKEETELEMNHFFEQGSDCSTLFNRPILDSFPVKKIKVAVTTLDKFTSDQGITHINFLKIDTEGAELDVLVGAQKLIKNNAIDIIQFEYGGTYPDAHITLFNIYHYLTSNQYLIFRIMPSGLIYIPEWDEELENFKYSNYLALKKYG